MKLCTVAVVALLTFHQLQLTNSSAIRSLLPRNKGQIKLSHPQLDTSERKFHNGRRTYYRSVVNISAEAQLAAQSEKYWYTRILPVLPSELPKFFALSFMMFWIIYIFTIARDTKDALIVTNCGAEAIAFLKVYGVVPAAAAFMVLYSNLANHFSPRALFYITIAPFMAFYAAFAFVLYPMRHALHPMSITVPEGGMSFAVNLLRHWTFSLYYIVSELWGSAGVPLLFWSVANDVIRIDQAKRIYPLIALVGNLGPIFSGLSMTLVSKYVSLYFSSRAGGGSGVAGMSDDRAFETSLKVLAVLSSVAGACICMLYYLVHRLNDADLLREKGTSSSSLPEHIGGSNSTTPGIPVSVAAASAVPVAVITTRKPSLTLSQSARVLSDSPYLRSVATMVLSYGLTMEFTEIIWKSAVKLAYPVKTDYLRFMGRYSALVGCAAFVMMFVGANVVDGLGWRAGALVTPVMTALLAVPFFACIIFGGLGSQSTLLAAVYVGLVQNVLSKATKYAIFDPTKEMTYIPLDKASKTQGKAAIDVLGARVGKSGGALVQQVLVLAFGSILRGAPLVAVLFYMSIFAWIGAVNTLSPMFARQSASSSASTAVASPADTVSTGDGDVKR